MILGLGFTCPGFSYLKGIETATQTTQSGKFSDDIEVMAMKVQCSDEPSTVHTLYDGSHYVAKKGAGTVVGIWNSQ